MRLEMRAKPGTPNLPEYPRSLAKPQRLAVPCRERYCVFRRSWIKAWRTLRVWWSWYGIEHAANRDDCCASHRAYAQRIVAEFDPFTERDW